MTDEHPGGSALREVLVDLTPAAGGHGQRGIGSYVRGLATALACEPALASRVAALAVAPVPGLHTVLAPRLLGVRPQDVGAATGWLLDGLALRRAGVRAVHQGDPFRPLRPPGATRVAVTVHDLISLEQSSHLVQRRHRRAVYGAYLRSIRRADRVQTVSRTTADAVAGHLGVDRERIDVVPPVVLSPGLREHRPTREPVFLFVGVPEEHKQPDLAVQALAAYREQHGAGRLRFIGPLARGHREHLDDLSRRHGVTGAVQVDGRIDDAALAAAWASATALLAVSRVEGFGLPPVEAALRGVPVVAHDTPVARETVGEVATFVPADAAAVAEAMTAAAPPDEAARRRLAERHSPAAVAAVLARSYDRLLED